MPLIDRFGLRKTAVFSISIRIAVVAALLLIPVRHMTFSLYVTLLVIFGATSRIGMGACWQPLMRDITTADDRGRFFSRMRFTYTMFTAAAVSIIPLFVGAKISELQYKILLAIALVGVINQLYWVTKIPVTTITVARNGNAAKNPIFRRMWRVLRKSPLMRRPLLIGMLAVCIQVPIFPVYLKDMMHLPSNFVSIYLAAVTIAAAASFLLWGKVADTIGFKPMLTGILMIYIFALPSLLFITPLPAGTENLQYLNTSALAGLAILLAYGLISGGLLAGVGIASVSIQHHHVQRKTSLEALNLWNIIFSLTTSLFVFFSGFLLQDIAKPFGSRSLMGGMLHFDWIKGYLIFIGIPLQLIMIAAVKKLPNARPYFGLGDFFLSLTAGSLRAMLIQRKVYHEDERQRLGTARWLGTHATPMSIDPLIEMLRDPSFDVKAEAIRSLALTDSELASDMLIEILEDDDKRQLADHAAWALGQLRSKKAADVLITRLEPEWPRRIRAMAARALGKIGDQRAITSLLFLLETETASKYVISSACSALIQLNCHSELIFDKLGIMTRREARLELLDALCTPLEITNEWLLRFLGNETAHEALLEYIEHRSKSWRAERNELIMAVKKQDIDAVKSLFALASGGAPYDKSEILATLRKSLGKLTLWEPIAVLASAWLLLRKRHG